MFLAVFFAVRDTRRANPSDLEIENQSLRQSLFESHELLRQKDKIINELKSKLDQSSKDIETINKKLSEQKSTISRLHAKEYEMPSSVRFLFLCLSLSLTLSIFLSCYLRSSFEDFLVYVSGFFFLSCFFLLFFVPFVNWASDFLHPRNLEKLEQENARLLSENKQLKEKLNPPEKTNVVSKPTRPIYPPDTIRKTQNSIVGSWSVISIDTESKACNPHNVSWPISLSQKGVYRFISLDSSSSYRTTLANCSCPAYTFKTTRPCKHMIRLAICLGYYSKARYTQNQEMLNSCISEYKSCQLKK